MTIYVDPLQSLGAHWGKSCHMASDTNSAELVWFAWGMHIPLAWFQDHKLHPHFDLNKYWRDKVVASGAVELDERAFVLKTSRVFRHG